MFFVGICCEDYRSLYEKEDEAEYLWPDVEINTAAVLIEQGLPPFKED